MYLKIATAVYDALILGSGVWMFYCVWHSRNASERFSDFFSNIFLFTFFFILFMALFIYELAATFNDNLPYRVTMMTQTLAMLLAIIGILNTFAIQLVVFKILDHMNYFSEAIKRRPGLSGSGSTNMFSSSRVRLNNQGSVSKKAAQHSRHAQENTECVSSSISTVIMEEFNEGTAKNSIPE